MFLNPEDVAVANAQNNARARQRHQQYIRLGTEYIFPNVLI